MSLICKLFGHNKKRKYWMWDGIKKTSTFGCSRCGQIEVKPMEYGWYQVIKPLTSKKLTLKQLKKMYKKASKCEEK